MLRCPHGKKLWIAWQKAINDKKAKQAAIAEAERAYRAHRAECAICQPAMEKNPLQ